jgi:NADH:ubiquinone oxidoreductase subunit 5 (subunit L)/multisubunit Na+/H+ antiporter MnhA subunit
MKDNIKIPEFNLKLSYVIPIVLIIFLGFITIQQWRSTSELRNANKDLKQTNETLLDYKYALAEKVRKDSLKLLITQITIDSLLVLDQKHIRQIYSINKKYEKLKMDYNTSNTDDKNRIFTDLINN